LESANLEVWIVRIIQSPGGIVIVHDSQICGKDIPQLCIGRFMPYELEEEDFEVLIEFGVVVVNDGDLNSLCDKVTIRIPSESPKGPGWEQIDAVVVVAFTSP
jgi:hypothetical protein